VNKEERILIMVILASLFLCSSKLFNSSKISYVLKTKKKEEKQETNASVTTCYLDTIFGINDLMTSLEFGLKFYLNP
jgi:hypothetical protein